MSSFISPPHSYKLILSSNRLNPHTHSLLLCHSLPLPPLVTLTLGLSILFLLIIPTLSLALSFSPLATPSYLLSPLSSATLTLSLGLTLSNTRLASVLLPPLKTHYDTSPHCSSVALHCPTTTSLPSTTPLPSQKQLRQCSHLRCIIFSATAPVVLHLDHSLFHLKR